MNIFNKRFPETPMEDKPYFDKLNRRLNTFSSKKVYTIDTDIYLLEDRGLLKIGRSKNYKNRVDQHKASNKFVKLIKVYKSDYRLEKYLHKKLSSNIVEGETEWFHIYDGIYNDIDKWVKFFHKRYCTRRGTPISLISDYPYKMFKFKSIVGRDFAFVIAKSEGRARELIKEVSFVKVVHVESKELHTLVGKIDKLILGEEYLYSSTLKTKREFIYCKNRGIDFNREYGITVKRLSPEELERYFDSYSSDFSRERKNYYNRKSSRGNRVARKIKRFYR